LFQENTGSQLVIFRSHKLSAGQRFDLVRSTWTIGLLRGSGEWGGVVDGFEKQN